MDGAPINERRRHVGIGIRIFVFPMSGDERPPELRMSLFPEDFTKNSPIVAPVWCVQSDKKPKSGWVLFDFQKGKKLVTGKRSSTHQNESAYVYLHRYQYTSKFVYHR